MRIARDDVSVQLTRILASRHFRVSGRLSEFLTYTVKSVLEGQGDALKESVVGVEALGKPADFDPRTDPAVRVIAGRVRKRLKDYYDAEGSNDKVVILLPQAGYAPVITLRQTAVSDSETHRACWQTAPVSYNVGGGLDAGHRAGSDGHQVDHGPRRLVWRRIGVRSAK